MIICRKCQRHHPDDVGAGPCECGADLKRDGVALGPSPAAGPSVFGDDAADPFADPFADPEPSPPPASDPPAASASAAQAPPAPAPAPPAPADPAPSPAADRPPTAPPPTSPPPQSSPPPTSPPSSPAPPSDQPAPVRPDLPPPPRRAPSFNPADIAAQTDELPAAAEATDEISVAETEPVEPARRAPAVTPNEVLAAREQPDAANVGEIPDDDPGTVPSPSDAATAPTSTASREPGPGELACPTCREPNELTRRFCFNCGASLPQVEVDEDDLPEMTGPHRPSLWSRLTGSKQGKRTARTFQGKAKQAAGGKLRYAQGFTSRAKITALVGMLMAGGGVMAILGPYRGMLDGIIDRGPKGTSPESAEILEATEVAGFPAGNAIDEDDVTGFAFFFDPDGEFANLTVGDDAPAPEGTAPDDQPDDAAPDDGADEAAQGEAPTVPDAPSEPGTLLIRLEEPTDVSELYLAVGLPDSVEDGPLMQRPSRIEVCAEGANCQELELADSTSLKEYGVDFGGEVRLLRITPLEVHDSPTTTYPLAVIGEIRVG